MGQWDHFEAQYANFGDQRLNDRMELLLDRLGNEPEKSIPTSCQGWAETFGAYRFFENDRVTYEQVIESHYRATFERMKLSSVVLAVQDPSQCIFLRQLPQKKIGSLKHYQKQTVLAHATVAVTPSRVLLGTVDLQLWQRESAREDAKIRQQKKVQKAVDEKESYYWLESYEQSCAVQGQLPDTQVVNVGDRAGDIYELFELAQQHQPVVRAGFIVRCEQTDRRVQGQDGSRSSIEAELKAQPVLARKRIRVKKKGKNRRWATLDLKAMRLDPEPPWRAGGHKLDRVVLYAVLAKEVNPPAGQPPLEWILLTNLRVESAEEAKTILSWYSCRWEIELLFYTLKQGCRIEQLKLRTQKRLYCALALYAIVAWRVEFAKKLSRQCPSEPAEVVFTRAEWEAAYIAQGKRPPTKVPKLGAVLLLVAMLGGYLNRKHDPPPGSKVIWLGLMKLAQSVQALEHYKALYPQ